MLKLNEEKTIYLELLRNKPKIYRISNGLSEYDMFNREWSKIILKEKLTINTDIDNYFENEIKDFKDKPNRECGDKIKLYLHEQKENLIKNAESNKKYDYLIKFGDLIVELKNLLDKNIYVNKNENNYTMVHNDDLIKFEIHLNGQWGYISLIINIDEEKICNLNLQAGKDANIQYLAPNFTFDSLISLINNSIDILKIRNQKIEVKRNEFKNEIKNFYNEEKMEDLINRIKNNV